LELLLPAFAMRLPDPSRN